MYFRTSLLLLLLLSLISFNALAGRDVLVSWTIPPQPDATHTIDEYFLFYTYPTSAEVRIVVSGYTTDQYVIPNAPFGKISVFMRSHCPTCTSPESNNSNVVTKEVAPLPSNKPQTPVVINVQIL